MSPCSHFQLRGLIFGDALRHYSTTARTTMLNKEVTLALAVTGGLGLCVHLFLQRDIEQRTEQQRVWKQHDSENIFGGTRPPLPKQHDQGPSKKALSDMLSGLQAKSTREKIEAAVDAAHMTHDIGFPGGKASDKAKATDVGSER